MMKVKREIRNLQMLELERLAISLAGQDGSIQIASHGHGIFSIRYVFDEIAIPKPTPDLESELRAPEYRDIPKTRQPWTGIEETERDFILTDGPATIEIVKATGTISAFWKGNRVFGGLIGTPDTVLPKYPLRVQDSGFSTGKFNFRAGASDIFIGLGEKSGKLDKNRRRFKMFNRDALGYEANTSDPLYKSIPFLMQANRREKRIVGIYFPHPSVEEIDLRVESNYYYSVKLNGAPYEYILFLGDNYAKILDGYTRYTGRPALPPRFSFGYFGSSMSYAEPDDAASRVSGFFDEVERRQIPCEGMYLSSGYAKADNGERYTFLWNAKKFPDPRGFMEKLRERGYRLCCNIKPGVLTTHPRYHEMESEGRFVTDAAGDPCTEYYWSNTASFVDFSRPEVREWWKEQLKIHFLRQGVEGIWNDNNEFEIEDESVPLHRERSLLTLLMIKSSFDALCEERPGKRPWIISRAGYAGMQRYARTWTGDNVSDEESMAASIPMGMNLGLSGVPFYGHDIGGFFGSSPSPELLLRWSQSSVFQPRFVMHSWNPDGNPTEPWTYPELFERIRKLIRLRYRHLPYLYSSAFQSALTGIPMERPLWLEFPSDGELPQESNAHLTGQSMLVVPPTAVKDHDVTWRFPADTAWVDGVDGTTLCAGGHPRTMPYPSSEPLYFYRTGSLIPLNAGEDKIPDGFSAVLDLAVVPLSGLEAAAESECVLYEDDGVSTLSEGSYSEIFCAQKRLDDGLVRLELKAIKLAVNSPLPRRVRLSVPPGFVIAAAGPADRGEAAPASASMETELTREIPARTFMIHGTYGSIGEPQQY